MASLSIRKLDDKTYSKLRIRAAEHHVSMEEEARQILSQAVSPPQRISDVFRINFGQKNGVDLESFSQRTPHLPLSFDE